MFRAGDEEEVRYSLLSQAAGDLTGSDGEESNWHFTFHRSPSRLDLIQNTIKGLNCHKRSGRFFGCLVTFCSGVLLTCCILIIVISVSPLSFSLQPNPSFNEDDLSQVSIDSQLPGQASPDGILPPSVKSSDPSVLSDWEFELLNVGSESPLRSFDINDDGSLDIMLGLVYSKLGYTNQTKHCKLHGAGSGCKGGILALDGRNGEILWRMHTKDEVYELTCPDSYDVNGDGASDCIASGRFGTFMAFDPRAGKLIWSMPTSVNMKWNVFAAAFIQDIDDDGVGDMVVVNGGDTTFQAGELNRPGNWVVVVSGRTGDMIGERTLPIPNDHESYSLPTVYNMPDGSQYIFFGSGGETIQGGLHVISLKDLLTYIRPLNPYQLKGGYTYWKEVAHSKHATGVVTLYWTNMKGVILPVTFADLNNDGMNDILAITFDGIVLAYSGLDLTYLWPPQNFSVGTASTESYSFPGFGFFNDDEYLDIMIGWQTGSYPLYDSLMIYILDGKSGDVLWYKDSPGAYDYTVSPPLTLSTSMSFRDAFIFRISSTNVPFKTLTNHSDPDHSDLLTKRHIGMHEKGAQSCDDMDTKFVDTFIMDRSNMESPLLLYTQHAQPYYYNVTKELVEEYKMTSLISSLPDSKRQRYPRHAGSHDDAETNSDSMQKCSRFNPRDSSAGILLDINNDGEIEYVTVDVAFTNPNVYGYHPASGVVLKTIIRKFSLEKLWKLNLLTQINLEEVTTTFSSSERTPLANISLAHMSTQKWPQHLGRYQNGVY